MIYSGSASHTSDKLRPRKKKKPPAPPRPPPFAKGEDSFGVDFRCGISPFATRTITDVRYSNRRASRSCPSAHAKPGAWLWSQWFGPAATVDLAQTLGLIQAAGTNPNRGYYPRRDYTMRFPDPSNVSKRPNLQHNSPLSNLNAWQVFTISWFRPYRRKATKNTL